MHQGHLYVHGSSMPDLLLLVYFYRCGMHKNGRVTCCDRAARLPSEAVDAHQHTGEAEDQHEEEEEDRLDKNEVDIHVEDLQHKVDMGAEAV
jgi:hypothetical protein